MIRMIMGLALSPQWFSMVTATPTFSPYSAICRNDDVRLHS